MATPAPNTPPRQPVQQAATPKVGGTYKVTKGQAPKRMGGTAAQKVTPAHTPTPTPAPTGE